MSVPPLGDGLRELLAERVAEHRRRAEVKRTVREQFAVARSHGLRERHASRLDR